MDDNGPNDSGSDNGYPPSPDDLHATKPSGNYQPEGMDSGDNDADNKDPSPASPEDEELESLLNMADDFVGGEDGAADGEDDQHGGAEGLDEADEYLEDDPSMSTMEYNDALNELPPWANKDNKALNKIIIQKSKVLAQTRQSIQENVDRIAVMSEHLKNVRVEHAQTQSLLQAKNTEVETEHHMHKIAERNLGRLRSDVNRVHKDIQDVQDNLNGLQAFSLKATEKLEKYRTELNWNQEELLQWSLAARQKEEDLEAIRRYQQQDNAVITQLTEKLRRETRLSFQASQALEKEVTEAKAAQLELDSIANALKHAHVQRQEMIGRWSDAVKSLHRRDDQLVRMGDEMGQLRSELGEAEAALLEQERALSREQSAKTQTEAQLAVSERDLAKKRTQLQQARADADELQDLLATQRGEGEKLQAELSAVVFVNGSLRDLRDERARKLSEYKQLVAATRAQLQSGAQDTDELRSKAAQIEALHTQHGQKLRSLRKELESSKAKLFKQSQTLFTMRAREAELVADISAAQNATKNLGTRVKVLDAQTLQKQEMLYTVEFRVQQLERAVGRAAGKRSVEETVALTAQLSTLQAQLGLHETEHAMLVEQTGVVQADLRKSKQQLQAAEEKCAAAAEELVRVQLEVDTTEREVTRSTKQRTELLLRHAGLSVEAEQLGKQLSARRAEVLSLEQQTSEVELSVKRQEKQVRVEADVARAEARAAEDARAGVMKDLREREMWLEKLRCRHDTIQSTLGGGGGDGAWSTAALLLETAQKRQALSAEGDALNAHIQQKQREVLLLQQTLATQVKRTAALRSGNGRVSEDSKEMQQLRVEEQRLREVREQLSQKQALLRAVEADYEEKRVLLATLAEEVESARAQGEAQTAALQQLRKEVAELEKKHARATQTVALNRQELRAAAGVGRNETADEELYVSVMEARKRSAIVNEMLAVLSQQHPDLSEQLQQATAGLANTTPAAARPASVRGRVGGSRPQSARPTSATPVLPPLK